MVSILKIFPVLLLFAGAAQAACPEALLTKICNQDNVGDRKNCLVELRRDLEACISSSDSAIKNSDKKVVDATKAKRDKAVGALSGELSAGVEDGRKVEAAFNNFKATITDIKNEYASFTRQFFSSYKANENSSADKLEQIAAKLSLETVSELVEAQYQAIAVARAEQNLAFKNESTIQLLLFKARYLENGMSKEFAGLGNFLKSKGLEELTHPFDEMTPSLEKMHGYIQERSRRYSTVASDLDKSFVARIEVIKSKNVEAAIGEELKIAAALNSSAQFMGDVEDARVLAFKTAPASPTYGVPSYGEQYLALQKFVSFGSICDNPNSPGWTKSGCLNYSRYIDNAKRLYIGVGLANYCIQNIPKIQSANPQIPNELFARMRELLSQKKYPDVIALHDSLLKIERKP